MNGLQKLTFDQCRELRELLFIVHESNLTMMKRMGGKLAKPGKPERAVYDRIVAVLEATRTTLADDPNVPVPVYVEPIEEPAKPSVESPAEGSA